MTTHCFATKLTPPQSILYKDDISYKRQPVLPSLYVENWIIKSREERFQSGCQQRRNSHVSLPFYYICVCFEPRCCGRRKMLLNRKGFPTTGNGGPPSIFVYLARRPGPSIKRTTVGRNLWATTAAAAVAAAAAEALGSPPLSAISGHV